MVEVKRHIGKAVSYRMLGTFQTCLISYLFTGNFLISGSIGLTELCIKPLIYFDSHFTPYPISHRTDRLMEWWNSPFEFKHPWNFELAILFLHSLSNGAIKLQTVWHVRICGWNLLQTLTKIMNSYYSGTWW